MLRADDTLKQNMNRIVFLLENSVTERAVLIIPLQMTEFVSAAFKDNLLFISHCYSSATFIQLCSRFCPSLLMKMVPVHIASFSNEYAMKATSFRIAPEKRGVVNPFSIQSLFISCQKGPMTSL